MISLDDVLHIVNTWDLEKRKKLNGIEFILENEAIKLDNEGNYIKAQYFNASRQVVIYSIFIQDMGDLQRTLLHELRHHFGMDDVTMKQKGLY